VSKSELKEIKIDEYKGYSIRHNTSLHHKYSRDAGKNARLMHSFSAEVNNGSWATYSQQLGHAAVLLEFHGVC
jgi:hypothetical protein